MSQPRMHPLFYHMVVALQPLFSNHFEHAADYFIVYSLPQVRFSSALFRLQPRDIALWPARACLQRLEILMLRPLPALHLSIQLGRAWLIVVLTPVLTARWSAGEGSTLVVSPMLIHSCFVLWYRSNPPGAASQESTHSAPLPTCHLLSRACALDCCCTNGRYDYTLTLFSRVFFRLRRPALDIYLLVRNSPE